MAIALIFAALFFIMLTLYYQKKRMDDTDRINAVYLERMREMQTDTKDNVDALKRNCDSLRFGIASAWDQIDLLQKQVQYLEKGKIYDPNTPHEEEIKEAPL